MNKLKVWLALLFVVDLSLLVWRWTSTGTTHSLVTRIQDLTTVQIFMSIFSFIVYNRCSGCPNNQLAHRIFTRLIVALFLVVAHSVWLFFYVYLPDNSRFVILCFLCISVYVHWASFLLPLIALEKLLDFFLPNARHPVLKSQPFHTYVSLFFAFILTAFGLIATQVALTVQRSDVLIPGLPDNLNGFTIALVTDVHIGPTVGKDRVEQIVSLVNSLDADMIAIAGDLVDGFLKNLENRALPLANLKAKHGVFYATGNHEYYHGSVDEWIKFFSSKLHFQVLRNTHKIISLNVNELGKEETHQHNLDQNEMLCVVGLDDLITEKLFITGHKMDPKRAVERCPPKSITVVLAHQPNAARKIIDSTNRHIDLILSGHTHNGQFYVFWPIVYLRNAFLHGLYKDSLSGTQVYVSAGVNYWGPPIKMWNNCEIVLISLKSGSKSSINELSDVAEPPLVAGIGGNLPGT